MNDTQKKLMDYFNRLVHRFLNTRSLQLELQRTLSWQSPSKIETLNLSSYFFHLAIYSMSRTILVELTSFLSSKEDRSLVGWLEKAKEHADSLEPSVYDPSLFESERKPLLPVEYQTIIDGHLDSINAYKMISHGIKARRDKVIAHMDQKYFDDPNAIYKDFPVDNTELENLFDKISEILHKHHSLLFHSDMNMEVRSAHHVDVVLTYARAHMRARQDMNLIKKGYRPIDYERD